MLGQKQRGGLPWVCWSFVTRWAITASGVPHSIRTPQCRRRLVWVIHGSFVPLMTKTKLSSSSTPRTRRRPRSLRPRRTLRTWWQKPESSTCRQCTSSSRSDYRWCRPPSPVRPRGALKLGRRNVRHPARRRTGDRRRPLRSVRAGGRPMSSARDSWRRRPRPNWSCTPTCGRYLVGARADQLKRGKRVHSAKRSGESVAAELSLSRRMDTWAEDVSLRSGPSRVDGLERAALHSFAERQPWWLVFRFRLRATGRRPQHHNRFTFPSQPAP